MDRRGMLKKAGAIAAGVAAVGWLQPTMSAANGFQPNSTGAAMIIGGTNSPTNPGDKTLLQNPASGLSSILFQADNFQSTAFSAPANTISSIVGHVDDAEATPANQNLVGVYGEAITGGNGVATGLVGNGTTYGVQGTGLVGVLGTGSGSGCGVDGASYGNSTIAFGVRGTAFAGAGGAFSGDRAAVVLTATLAAVPNPNVSIPNGGTPGDLYRGSADSSLWYNAGGTNPYRRLADSSTAGALTPFAAAGRFVNTITGSGAPYAGQHLAAGATAAYQIGGVTVNGVTVPTTARAIIGRIADPNPSGAGNLLVGATNPPVGGVIAIVTGAPQNSFFFSALDASGLLYVKNSGSGPTDIIIDIQGYYL